MGVRGVLMVVAAVLLAACGSDDADSGTVLQTPPPSGPVEIVAPQGSDVSTPSPEEIAWLAPASEVDGLLLVEALRGLEAGCVSSVDYESMYPCATLVFDTSDLAVGRSLLLRQAVAGTDALTGSGASGEVRTVGQREVVVDEQGSSETPMFTVTWSEPGGIEVELQATGLGREEVEAFVTSLRPVDPEAWPGIAVDASLERCVGDRTRYAPADVPEGWTRFVLDAAPVGACDVDQFVFMSLVVPGTADQPGTLVTFVSTPASAGVTAVGEPVDINGVTGHLQSSTQADGTPSSTIILQLGDAVVDGHGNVDPATLVELMETVRLLGDDEWSQLVAEIDSPPGG